jgi:RHS repeat-associated protein
LFAQWYDDQTGDKPTRDAVRVAYHGYIPEHATLTYIGDERRMTRYLGRMRWYDARLGRWLTRDPAGYVDGLNVYLFVGGNPVMLVDPTGLLWTWIKNTASDAWDGAKEVGSFVVTGGGNLAAEANRAASEDNLYGRNVGAYAKGRKDRGDAAGAQAAMAAGAKISNETTAAVAANIEERAETSVDIVMTAAGGGGKLVSAAADVAQVAVDISSGQSPVASVASLLPGVSSGSVNAVGGVPGGARAAINAGPGAASSLKRAAGAASAIQSSAASSLPTLKGKTVAYISTILQDAGFIKKPKKTSVNQDWNHPDGSQVRIHPYGNEDPTPYRSGNNAHVHKEAPGGVQLNDRGLPDQNKDNTHIGIPNRKDHQAVRGRPNGA